MTANELEKLYLDAYKKITDDVPEGAPAGIDVNAALSLDVRFILGYIIHHTKGMKSARFPPDMYLEQLRSLNSLLKDTGFTIIFDEKVLD